MVMRGLETAATVTLMIAIVPFISAWESSGEGGRKYRETIKKICYFGVALLVVPAGMLLGAVTMVVAPLDPRPPKSCKGLKSYRYRRSYLGRHYSGASVQRILDAVAA